MKNNLSCPNCGCIFDYQLEVAKQNIIVKPEEGKIYNKNKNKELGFPHTKGYRCFYFNGKIVSIHRFIWSFVHGSIPKGMQIDHINQIKSDNRISNLRLVTAKDNHRNMPLLKNNKTGVNGVYKNKKTGKYVAQCISNKTKIHIGTFDTLEEARVARKKVEEELGFHENHGKGIV